MPLAWFGDIAYVGYSTHHISLWRGLRHLQRHIVVGEWAIHALAGIIGVVC